VDKKNESLTPKHHGIEVNCINQSGRIFVIHWPFVWLWVNGVSM